MSWRTHLHTFLHTLPRRPAVLVALAALVGVGVVWALLAAAPTPPKTLDERTYAVAAQIQCPVCNGESVADASSLTAQQMRGVIRQKLARGESDQQVLRDFQTAYGDAILESPPKQGFTALIWLAPILMLLAGGALVVLVAREWRPAPAASPAFADAAEYDASLEAELSPEERARLAAVLRRELAADEGIALDEGLDDGRGND